MAQTTTSKRIYLAGPLGFSEVGRDFHEKIVRAVIDAGHIPLDPWKLTDPNKIAKVVQLPFGQAKRDAWRVLNKEIGAMACTRFG